MPIDASPSFDFDKPLERKRGAGRGSKFFVLDRTHWEAACGAATSNRLNLLTAMLVLLAGTGADQMLTKWSAKACEQYAGMGNAEIRLARCDVDAFVERALLGRNASSHLCLLKQRQRI